MLRERHVTLTPRWDAVAAPTRAGEAGDDDPFALRLPTVMLVNKVERLNDLAAELETLRELAAVAYPMLAKAGYERNAAGGLLAAGGLGAILSPPVLGAAAFLISEFLKISYLDVIRMAVIPTCLYYLSLFLMVELDSTEQNRWGRIVEYDATEKIFTNPSDPRTEDYVSGKVG